MLPHIHPLWNKYLSGRSNAQYTCRLFHTGTHRISVLIAKQKAIQHLVFNLLPACVVMHRNLMKDSKTNISYLENDGFYK